MQLTGKRSWRDEDEKVDHLNLTPADILTIAPYLHNDRIDLSNVCRIYTIKIFTVSREVSPTIITV